MVDALSRVCFQENNNPDPENKDISIHFLTDIKCPLDIETIKTTTAEHLSNAQVYH